MQPVPVSDIDRGWGAFKSNFVSHRVERGMPAAHRGSLLYYSSLCGFWDLTAHLIAKYPQHVNPTLSPPFSPLVAALHKHHFDIAELLYQHGADVGFRGNKNRTLLHASSETGIVDTTQWLLDHYVDGHSRRDNHEAPLHLAEAS